MAFRLLIILILSGLLVCQSSDQTRLNQDQQKLVLVYVDLLFLQQTLSPTDSAYADSCQSLLENYEISESSYQEVIHSISQQPEQWETFYQAVLDEIDRRNKQQPAG